MTPVPPSAKEHAGSNRTFMELKLRNENVPMFEYGVLIAPLWN